MHYIEMEALSDKYGGTYSEWENEDAEAISAYLSLLEGKRRAKKEQVEEKENG